LVGSDVNQGLSINGADQTDGNQMVDIFAEGPKPTPLPTVGLPLPPPLPDYSTLSPSSALPEFNSPYATSNSSTIPTSAPATNDPSQFQIPV